MARVIADFSREQALLAVDPGCFPIGVDEAGRGPLAGPVVACAALLKDWQEGVRKLEAGEFPKEWNLVRDSKKLSPAQREKAYDFVGERFHVGVGIIGNETIDRVNILEATFLAMRAAVSDLKRQVAIAGRQGKGWDEAARLLIDGNQEIPNLSLRQEVLVGGDGVVKSIAAASIVAKVTRDRIMDTLDREYPVYGFARHKGYGTKEHMDALRRHGPAPIHRMSFRPVFLSVPENANRRFGSIMKPKNK